MLRRSAFLKLPRTTVSVIAAACVCLALTLSLAVAESPRRGEPSYSPALEPMLQHAERQGRGHSEAAARRTVAYYLHALQGRNYHDANEWMPTELRRGEDGQLDMTRNVLVWEALTIERFVVEDVRIAGERHAIARVRWSASFDRERYIDSLTQWQRQRSLALGLEPSDVERRMPLVRTMATRAAERLEEIVTQPGVRLRLRPSDPDARVHPLSYTGWRIEDTFLPSID